MMLHAVDFSLVIDLSLKEDMPIVYVNHVFENATGYSAAEVVEVHRFTVDSVLEEARHQPFSAELDVSPLQVVGRNCRFLQAPPSKQRTPSAAAQAVRRALDGGRAKGVRLLNYMKDGTPVFNDLCAAGRPPVCYAA